MNDHWYNRRPGRERVLLFLVVIAATLAGWYRLVWLPFAQERARMEKGLADTAHHRADRPTDDQPEAPWLHLASQWVPAGESAGLLARLTQTTGGLRLIGLAVQPPNRLLSCAKGLNHDDPGTLFRQELTLTWEGEYPALLTYMHRLEATPWPVQVDHLDYTVHPPTPATLLLKLHFFTLSRSPFVD